MTAEVVGGALLLAVVILAIVWSNLDAHGYSGFWSIPARSKFGALELPGDLASWVTEGAMTLFFLLVGLELDRELHGGELTGRSAALLPVAGALGGMAGAAVTYLAVAHSSQAVHGYGVPMATDVAFALGALALVRTRVPRSVMVFVLALAVADDLGSVAVLAIGYSQHLAVARLAVAFACLGALIALRLRGLRAPWPYLLLGVLCWEALVGSGVEPVLAGVAIGLTVPPGPRGDRLEAFLGPFVTFALLPVFALANAGVRLEFRALTSARALAVLVGVVLARVVGKPAGILAGAWIASRVASRGEHGPRRLALAATWRQLTGAALMCGIGFTVPLLFAGVAFAGDPGRLAAARVGLYVGSAISFALGAAVLLVPGRGPRRASGTGREPVAGPPAVGR